MTDRYTVVPGEIVSDEDVLLGDVPVCPQPGVDPVVMAQPARGQLQTVRQVRPIFFFTQSTEALGYITVGPYHSAICRPSIIVIIFSNCFCISSLCIFVLQYLHFFIIHYAYS